MIEHLRYVLFIPLRTRQLHSRGNLFDARFNLSRSNRNPSPPVIIVVHNPVLVFFK